MSWTTSASEVVYSGRMTVRLDSVINSRGDRSVYEVDVSLPFAVAVLVLDGTSALLSYQYRYPIDQWVLDLPGGAGDAGEMPEDAARRELLEETGIEVESLKFLQKFYPNPGRSAWPVYLFCGSRASTIATPPDDPWEVVDKRWVSVDDLETMISRGEIVDPSLLIAWQSARLRGLLTS